MCRLPEESSAWLVLIGKSSGIPSVIIARCEQRFRNMTSRIHSTPLEDPHRQYILEEEELVEEMVDSISEIASHRSDFDRPNWRVVNEQQNSPVNDEDDNETLVPDNISEDENSPKITKEDVTEKSTISENWKLRESTTILSSVKYGKEERAVDVPDGASAVSAATTVAKAKAGKRENVQLSCVYIYTFIFARLSAFDRWFITRVCVYSLCRDSFFLSLSFDDLHRAKLIFSPTAGISRICIYTRFRLVIERYIMECLHISSCECAGK